MLPPETRPSASHAGRGWSQTDRQTDRQTETHTNTHTQTQTHTHTNTHTHKQTKRLLKPDQQHYRVVAQHCGRGPPACLLRYNYSSHQVPPPPPPPHMAGLLFAAPQHSSRLAAEFRGSVLNAQRVNGYLLSARTQMSVDI